MILLKQFHTANLLIRISSILRPGFFEEEIAKSNTAMLVELESPNFFAPMLRELRRCSTTMIKQTHSLPREVEIL